MFEAGIDAVLILNAIVVGIQSYPLLTGSIVHINPKYYSGAIDTYWEVAETVFTSVYVLEVFVKVLVLGWKKYAESGKNLFDISITLLALSATLYVYCPNQYSDSRLIRYVIMARVLRLSRLLFAMKPFQVIAGITAEIFPLSAHVLLLLFSIMYIFAALGMYLFGGMISRDPNNPLSYLVLNTDFSENEYWANNFNDMISGVNVLFNLLVVNNWTECAVGFEAVTQTRLSRLFFLIFHIIGVIGVSNVVIAVIVNSFIEQWDIQQERLSREEVDSEAVIEDRTAFFDATVVTGTKTNLTGKYVARVGRLGAHQHQQAFLKKIFTKTNSTMSETKDPSSTLTTSDSSASGSAQS